MTDLAIFVPSLRGGGAEQVMLTLAEGFTRRGLSVDLVLARGEGPLLSKVPRDIRVVDLKAPRVLRSIPGLAAYLKAQRPTAILSAMAYANVAALVSHRIARVPTRIVISEHNPPSVSLGAKGKAPVRFAMRVTYRWADKVVGVSRGVAEDVKKMNRLESGRVVAIYNPVVTGALLAQRDYAVTHPWLNQERVPVLLSVGRLAPQKDFSTLIHAFAKLRARRPVKLIILGEGPMRGELEDLVRRLDMEAYVDMPGFVDHPYAWMRRASLFALSSKFEGLGNVLVEALAAGVPVVSTNCPYGPSEILEGGRWGRLVPLGDSGQLARAMDEALASGVRGMGMDRALEFGEDRAVARYMKVLEFSDKQAVRV